MAVLKVETDIIAIID